MTSSDDLSTAYCDHWNVVISIPTLYWFGRFKSASERDCRLCFSGLNSNLQRTQDGFVDNYDDDSNRDETIMIMNQWSIEYKYIAYYYAHFVADNNNNNNNRKIQSKY